MAYRSLYILRAYLIRGMLNKRNFAEKIAEKLEFDLKSYALCDMFSQRFVETFGFKRVFDNGG